MVDRGRIELPTPGFSVGKRTAVNRPGSAAIGPNLPSPHAFQAPLATPAPPIRADGPRYNSASRRQVTRDPAPPRRPPLDGASTPAQDRGGEPALGVAPGYPGPGAGRRGGRRRPDLGSARGVVLIVLSAWGHWLPSWSRPARHGPTGPNRLDAFATAGGKNGSRLGRPLSAPEGMGRRPNPCEECSYYWS
jgi:hypothetical protein